MSPPKWSVAAPISSRGGCPFFAVSATNATWPPVRSRSSRARPSSSGIDAATTPTRRASPFSGSPATTGAAATTASVFPSRIVAVDSFQESSGSATQATLAERTPLLFDRGPVASRDEDARPVEEEERPRVQDLRLVLGRVPEGPDRGIEDRLDARLLGHRPQRRLQLRLETRPVDGDVARDPLQRRPDALLGDLVRAPRRERHGEPERDDDEKRGREEVLRLQAQPLRRQGRASEAGARRDRTCRREGRRRWGPIRRRSSQYRFSSSSGGG